MTEKHTRKFREIKNSKLYVGKLKRVLNFFSPIAEEHGVNIMEWNEVVGEVSLGSIRNPANIDGIKIIVPLIQEG